MAVSALSKALQGAASYATKWHQKRIHRLLDDRDDVLDEALEIIEDFDTTIYPHVSGVDLISGTLGATSTTDIVLEVFCAGLALQSGDTITAVIGGLTATAAYGSATKIDITITGGPDAFTYANAGAGDVVPLYIRVNSVLLPPVSFTLT